MLKDLNLTILSFLCNTMYSVEHSNLKIELL